VKTLNVLLLASGFGLFGCSGAPVNVTEVLNHAQCHALDKGFALVNMSELPRIRGARLLTLPEAPRHEQNVVAAKFSLVAIFNGNQPTTGYQFELLSATAHGLEVRLNYAWQTPPRSSMQAQMITAPCSVVQIDHGNQDVTVSAWVDGSEFGSLELKAALSQ